MNSAIAILTVAHVLVSVVGLATGFVVIWGFLRNRGLDRWTMAFLVTTIATSASGFLFPAHRVTPGHVIGVMSLLILGVAWYALYARGLAGKWRKGFVVSAVTAQYLNFFVLIVQLFLKVPALKALAPTQTEPVFAAVQIITLAGFVGLGVLASARFRGRTNTSGSMESVPHRDFSGHQAA